MKKLLLLLAPLGLFACSSTPSGNDGGNQDGGGCQSAASFNVSGHASVYPVARDFLADAGQSETVVGLTVRVEEPFKVATSSGGIFSVATLDSSATFSASGLSPDDVVLGVGAGIYDDAGTADGGVRVIRSATTLYDVALHDGCKPAGDITGAEAYALPVAFHDALVQAITPAKIQQLTQSAPNGPVSTLVEAGCMIGRVVDAAGAPVAGVTVKPSSFSSNFFYPTEDFTGTGTATSANGLFVYVHNGGAVSPFNFTINGHSEYKQRNAGATPDACLILDVFPGLNPP